MSTAAFDRAQERYDNMAPPEDGPSEDEDVAEQYVTVKLKFTPCTIAFPDAEMTVLVSISGGNEPTWPAFTDGEDWFDACTGGRLEGIVTHWAELPAGIVL